jgi:hypothetical protein
MRDPKALKNFLRLLREERGFSQLPVAEALRVDPSTTWRPTSRSATPP